MPRKMYELIYDPDGALEGGTSLVVVLLSVVFTLLSLLLL